MKPLIFTFTGSCLAWIMYAQPAFTSNDFPSIGASDSTHAPTMHQATNIQTETGSNYTWDFTSLSPVGDKRFVTFGPFNHTEGPVSPNFPDANLQKLNNLYDEKRIFEKTNDSIYLLWKYTNSVITEYNPQFPFLHFPMNFGEENTATRPYFVGVNEVAQVSTYWKYDGFGTLQLPWATHNNVFRIRSIQEDSTYATSFVYRTETYTWYKQGGAVPLLELSIVSYNGVPILPAGYYMPVANLTNGSNTSIHDLTFTTEIHLFPNPAKEQIQVISSQDLNHKTYRILNAEGKVIQAGKFTQSPATIQLETLSAGIYYLQIDQEKVQKFVLE